MYPGYRTGARRLGRDSRSSKISAAFKPSYGGLPCMPDRKSSVLTKEEWGHNMHATEDEREQDD